MPNLYLKIDIDTEVFTESGKKMKETIESINNIVIQYKGFSDVEFNYGIYVDKDDFIKDYEIFKDAENSGMVDNDELADEIADKIGDEKWAKKIRNG